MKHVVECGCSYDDQKDGIWWCPLHLKAKEMELQIDGLKKDLQYHETVCWPENDKLRKDLEESNRLNGELKKQLRAAQDVINKHVADQIEGLHCVDCVAEEGQGCDCPMVAPIFDAMKGYCAHANIEAFGEGFRRCKDCGEVEPPYKAKPTEKRVEPVKYCLCQPPTTATIKKHQEGCHLYGS